MNTEKMSYAQLDDHILSDKVKWGITAVVAALLIAAVAALGAYIFGAFDGDKLPQGTNAVVRDNPGKWYYNASEAVQFSEEPTVKNGVLTVTAETWGTDNFYFRYQPGEKEGLKIGDEFTVTFTAELSCDGDIRYRFDGTSSVMQEATLTAGEEKTFTLEGCVLTEGSGPFYVGVPAETEEGATFTLSDVQFEKVSK